MNEIVWTWPTILQALSGAILARWVPAYDLGESDVAPTKDKGQRTRDQNEKPPPGVPDGGNGAAAASPGE